MKKPDTQATPANINVNPMQGQSTESQIAHLTEVVQQLSIAQLATNEMLSKLSVLADAREANATYVAPATDQVVAPVEAATPAETPAAAPAKPAEAGGISWGGAILGTAIVGGLIYGAVRLFRN